MIHTALLAIAASVTQAPDTTVRVRTLDEATVTTQRNTALWSSVPLRRVSAADMELRGAVGLEEVLRTVAGVNVKDYGGIGGLKTVSIRSFGAQHTGVVYDGLALTDCMNGQVDIGRFNLEDVAEVCVDMAGTDDIFRPAKLSGYVGTVEMKSLLGSGKYESGRPAPMLKTSVRCGSFVTCNPHLSAQLPLSPRWNLTAWGDYLSSRGDYPFKLKNGQQVTDEVRLNSQVSRFNGELAANARLARFGSLRLKVCTYDSSRGLPGSVILYTQHPTEHLWDHTFTGSVQHALERGRWRWKSALSYNRAYNRYVDDDPLRPVPEDDRYTQQQASISSVVLLQVHERWSASLAEDFDVAHLDSNIPEAVAPTRESSYTALSTRYAGERLQAVGTLLGIVSVEQMMNGGTHRASASHGRHRSRLFPSLSASFRPLDGADWRLRASYKQTYRLPTFNDLYYARVGNRDLRPERAQQMNFGTTWAFRFPSAFDAGAQQLQPWRISLSADAYYNRVADKIVAIPTMFIWSMRNVGRVSMYGLDGTASLTGALAPWLRLQIDANYALQYALDVTDPAAKNYRDQIAYTPRHSGSGVVAVLMPWFDVSYTLTAVGERYSLAQATPAYRIAPYADHSVSINRTFTLRRKGGPRPLLLHVSAEALNLAGCNYEVVKYYPMPGRHFRCAVRFTY